MFFILFFLYLIVKGFHSVSPSGDPFFAKPVHQVSIFSRIRRSSSVKVKLNTWFWGASFKHSVVHKVLSYIEYRAVSGVFQNIDLPPPSPPSERVLPTHQRRGGGGGGVHTRRAVRRLIFWKTPDIGLASYSIISLRCCPFPSRLIKRLKIFETASEKSKEKKNNGIVYCEAFGATFGLVPQHSGLFFSWSKLFKSGICKRVSLTSLFLKAYLKQRCRSGMVIPDPTYGFFCIPDTKTKKP